MSTVGKKVTKGVGWVTVSSFGSQGVRLLVKLILARVLLPEHYGLIGMATIVRSLVTLISEFGMGAALIQKKDSELTETHFNTVFWINLGVSLVGYLLVGFALTPLAAWFYEEPFLYELIPVIAISIIIDSFYLVHRSKLTKKMNFKPQAIIEISAMVVSGVIAVYMAYEGYGVWSLAFNGIITSVFALVGYYFYLKWIPRLEFSVSAFKELFSFGGFVLIENIFYFLTRNIDYILIGKLIGSTALGAYTLAFILTDTLRKKTTQSFTKVLFPAFASFQDDHARIRKHYLTTVNITSCALIPVMTIFIFFAKPIVYWGFGEEWAATIIPLQFLSASVIVEVIFGSISPVLKGMGRADLLVKVSIFNTFAIAVPAIFLGSYLYGINGAAAAVFLYKLIGNGIYQYYVRILLDLPFIDVFKTFIRPLLVSSSLGFAIVLMLDNFYLNFLVQLILGVATFLLFYSAYIWYVEKAIVNRVLSIVKRKKV